MIIRRFLFLLFAVAALGCALGPPELVAQSTAKTFTLTAANQCAMIGVTGIPTVGIDVSGTFSLTLQPSVSINGGATRNSSVTSTTSGSSAQATVTATGGYKAPVGGFDNFSLCVSSYVSGSVTIVLNPSNAINAGLLGSGSGGSGTVTSVSGTANQIDVATGASTPVLSIDPVFIFPGSASAPTGLSVGANGGSTGVLTMKGSTSGAATFTAPAVAGTTSNPVVSSNALQLPSLGQGVAGLNYAGSTGFWSSDTTNHWLIWGSAAQDWFGLNNNGPGATLAQPGTLCWEPGNNIASGTRDVCFSHAPSSGNVVSLGTTASGDETGLLRDGKVCRITADVSLTVNVANPFCSFSFPALAKAWGVRCDVIWVISAGTGTNTFSLGVNPSQTPTGATNAAATIYTTQTGTQTQGVAALSASGALNVLTSPTYTPVATLEQALISGTILASATAGTFAVTATAAGTTVTGAVKAGTVCRLL